MQILSELTIENARTNSNFWASSCTVCCIFNDVYRHRFERMFSSLLFFKQHKRNSMLSLDRALWNLKYFLHFSSSCRCFLCLVFPFLTCIHERYQNHRGSSTLLTFADDGNLRIHGRWSFTLKFHFYSCIKLRRKLRALRTPHHNLHMLLICIKNSLNDISPQLIVVCNNLHTTWHTFITTAWCQYMREIFLITNSCKYLYDCHFHWIIHRKLNIVEFNKRATLRFVTKFPFASNIFSHLLRILMELKNVNGIFSLRRAHHIGTRQKSRKSQALLIHFSRYKL